MGVEISPTQQKRVDKIARLRQYFGQGEDRPEIYGWDTTDDSIDFKAMSDKEIGEYLTRHT